MDKRWIDVDDVARALAGPGRLSRRRALRRIGAGGAGAGLLATVGLRRATATVPVGRGEESDHETICRFAFEATVRVGPSSEDSATRTVVGELLVPITQDGAIVGGHLTLENGDELDVQGQATGRSVSLRIPFGDGDALVAVGAGFAPFAHCNVRYTGPASGPRPGDLGDWRAEPDPGPLRGFCPDEPECEMEAPCEEGTRQTTDCRCVTVGNAVCDVECEGNQTLSDDCECVCLA